MLMPALLLLAFQTATDTPPPPAPPPAQPANPESQRRVCRTTEVTGSRIAVRRVCRTAEEWRRQDGELNQDMREQRNATPSPVPPPMNS